MYQTPKPCCRLARRVGSHLRATLQATLLSAATLAAAAPAAQAGVVSLQGRLAADDSTFALSLALSADDVLAVRSLSWGGGQTVDGQAVAAGGFAPLLAVFDGTGSLLHLAQGSANTCGLGSGQPDPMLGLCWDALFHLSLPAGLYTLVLSQDGNLPGATLADAYSQAGQPNFSAGFLPGVPGAQFIDVTGTPRDSHWAFTAAADTLAVVPEPGTAGLAALALAALALRRTAPARRPPRA